VNQPGIRPFPASGALSVVLWGPPDAGKRWLLASFPRELAECNQNNPEFRCELYELRPDGSDLMLLEVAPPPVLTGSIQYHKWVFRRFPLVNDRAHRLSGYTHAMQVMCLPGWEGVSALFAPAEHETASAILARADCLVAVLDPCRLDSFQPEFPAGSPGESMLIKSVWSQEDYLKAVHALLQFLDRKGSPPRVVSVCISKMDRVGARGKPWQVLESLFGEQMVKMLEYYRSRLFVDVYPVTAFDGLPGGVPAPEQLDDNQWDTWKPFNTAAPFFHLFQERELALMKQRSLENLLFNRRSAHLHIPYPASCRERDAGGKEIDT
jgi:hypothetical protein